MYRVSPTTVALTHSLWESPPNEASTSSRKDAPLCRCDSYIYVRVGDGGRHRNVFLLGPQALRSLSSSQH